MKVLRWSLPALLLALPVQAAVFTVTKTADTFDGACDHDCSLREAVSAANSMDGVDVVHVPEGIYTLSRTGAGEDTNETGDLDVRDELLLVGAGPGAAVLDGFGSDRVLDMHAPAEIYGVTIRNGRVNGDGGGLLVRLNPSFGPVLLRRSIVSGNRALGDGGGIAVFAILEARESAILDNSAEGTEGAEGNGGGITVGNHGAFYLTNVTVSHNIAQGSGGGLDYPGDTSSRISGSTIAINQAGVSGGGIYARIPTAVGTGTPQLVGSIVALNTAPVDADCFGAGSIGYNVIEAPGSCHLVPTDRIKLPNQVQAVTDAYFASLGPTPVHVLTDGSPALDLVPAQFCEPADQVGQARSAPCDAGAWEKVVEHPDCVPGGSALCLQDGRFRAAVRWRTQPHVPGEYGQAVPLTDDTGNFWFFAPENLEVMIKVLNGCGLNGRWWVFASGLTDVGLDLEVWDLETGRIWFDHHEQGRTYPPRLDTDAFPCGAPAAALAAAGAPAFTGTPPAVLLVTKTADTFDGACDHDCSLREAVAAANSRNGLEVIVAGPGIYGLTREGRGEDLSASGDLDVLEDLVILGSGAKGTVLDGGGIDRVLHVLSDARLEIHGVTVRNGLALGSQPFDSGEGGGGGIRGGSVILVGCHVTGNRAEKLGGGVLAFEINATDTTFSDNEATSGGGIANFEKLRLSNVTVSGNRAAEVGGGLYLGLNDQAITQTTITGNRAASVGGLWVDCCLVCPSSDPFCHADFAMSRSILAGNQAATHPDCPGFIEAVPDSYNVFGIDAKDCTPGPTDLAGTPAEPLDPRLTPLGDHGGSTPTHVPLPESAAVDLALPGLCTPADQRGRTRPAGAGCDAGSVELLPSACQPDEGTLCLGAGDRFQVTVRWTAQGRTEAGRAVPLRLDSGAFWFFDPANVELTVKVLDGCGLNGRFWVFLTGLTDVGVQVEVRDMATGRTWTHAHPAGTPLQPRLDTNALDSCSGS